VASRCPRCKHWIPRDECPGEHPGAKSRVKVDDVRVIEICSICGEDEGYEMAFKGEYTPVGAWPITDWMDVTKQMEVAIKDMKEAYERGELPILRQQ
jgi:hypothetical protein